jgi:hypothetical protein
VDTDKSDIDAKAFFDSDRTCCVCRDRTRKHLQIHHIDGNHANDDPDNLAVLCLECHGDTLLKGGFSRHPSPKEVKLFRNDWLAIIQNERRNRPVEKEALPHLQFAVEKDPVRRFLKQFEGQHILPIGVTYHFRDYFFLTPGFPTIIADADNLSPENGEQYKSTLKAYLLCTLGAIAPQGVLTTNTLEPSQSLNSVSIGDVLIAVPRWFITGFEELGHLHLTGQYERNSNQILLTLAPMIQAKTLNYDLLGIKLEKIALALKGKNLHL